MHTNLYDPFGISKSNGIFDPFWMWRVTQPRAEDFQDLSGVGRATFCAWVLIIDFWFPPITEKNVVKKRRRG